jgi:hypothetical protein
MCSQVPNSTSFWAGYTQTHVRAEPHDGAPGRVGGEGREGGEGGAYSSAVTSSPSSSVTRGSRQTSWWRYALMVVAGLLSKSSRSRSAWCGRA